MAAESNPTAAPRERSRHSASMSALLRCDRPTAAPSERTRQRRGRAPPGASPDAGARLRAAIWLRHVRLTEQLIIHELISTRVYFSSR